MPLLPTQDAPGFHHQSPETQVYGTVRPDLPLGLAVEVREELVERLNQILADSIMLRALYNKSRWQVAGVLFAQLHQAFGSHHTAQAMLIEQLEARIQILGGIAVSMPADVAELSTIPPAPRGREVPSSQISRLLEAHGTILQVARAVARRADELRDDCTRDLLISQVLRTGEYQVWVLAEHLVDSQRHSSLP